MNDICRYCDPVEAAISLGVNSSGVITPSDCPTGHYCPTNTTSKFSNPCPPGTFNNITNLEMESQCTPCSAGYYCASFGKYFTFITMSIPTNLVSNIWALKYAVMIHVCTEKNGTQLSALT